MSIKLYSDKNYNVEQSIDNVIFIQSKTGLKSFDLDNKSDIMILICFLLNEISELKDKNVTSS